MKKVAVIGAGGYTGAEICRLCLNHPLVEIEAVTSYQAEGKRLEELAPPLQGLSHLVIEPLNIESIASRVDLVFTALPHTISQQVVAGFFEKEKLVVDLSADFRLNDVLLYEKWYQKHNFPHLIKEAIYGLPELYREKIKDAHLVANPGCYPTSTIIPLYPLLREGLIDSHSIIINSASGVSGAGMTPTPQTHFVSVNEGFTPYSIGQHRHTPEIEQELSLLAGEKIRVTFVPHLLPLSRGILSTIYATLRKETDDKGLLEIYQHYYRQEPFVRIYPAGRFPNILHVKGTNYCDIGIKVDGRSGRVVVLSALDNLLKGAAGQAVQNMNLMEGWEETTGLKQ